jgi:hypothetical protein
VWEQRERKKRPTETDFHFRHEYTPQKALQFVLPLPLLAAVWIARAVASALDLCNGDMQGFLGGKNRLLK